MRLCMSLWGLSVCISTSCTLPSINVFNWTAREGVCHCDDVPQRRVTEPCEFGWKRENTSEKVRVCQM